jgi:alcohol dehydrogenase (NADP+)
LISKGCKLGGSGIGSPADIAEMMDFAVEHKVHPFIQERPMKDANQAVLDMDKGDARYRYVLVNEKHAAEEKV